MNLIKASDSGTTSTVEIQQENVEINEDVNVIDITYEIGIIKTEDEETQDNCSIVEEQDSEFDFENVFFEDANEDERIDGPVIVQVTSGAGQPKTNPNQQGNFRRKISELQFELEQKRKEHHKLVSDWEAVTREWRVQRRNWEAQKRDWEKEKIEFQAKIQSLEREKGDLETEKRDVLKEKRSLENDKRELETKLKGWDEYWADFEDEKEFVSQERLKISQRKERQQEINRRQKKKRRWLKIMRERFNHEEEEWEETKKGIETYFQKLVAQKSEIDKKNERMELNRQNLETLKLEMEKEKKEFQKEREYWGTKKRSYEAEKSRWEGEITSWLNKRPKWEIGGNENIELDTSNLHLKSSSTSTNTHENLCSNSNFVEDRYLFTSRTSSTSSPITSFSSCQIPNVAHLNDVLAIDPFNSNCIPLPWI